MKVNQFLTDFHEAHLQINWQQSTVQLSISCSVLSTDYPAILFQMCKHGFNTENFRSFYCRLIQCKALIFQEEL
jgi:hypothetical protein